MTELDCDTTLEMLDKTLETILPDYCVVKGSKGSSIVANECFDEFLKEKGWSRDCTGAVVLLTGIISGSGWKIPQHIHDRVCACQKQHEGPKTRDRIMAPMVKLIHDWGLPTIDNPKIEDGINYYAEASGSRKYPCVAIRVFKGEMYHGAKSGGCATYDPRNKIWRLIYFYEPSGLESLPSTADRNEAIRTLISVVRQH